MLDKMHKEIDAVVVSTPDHTHFPATLAAMERGIHVYTQKPLTHNIWQARTLVKAKERYKVVTQMGNQGHAGVGIRKSVEAYRAGVIGEVSEVFARNDGPRDGRTAFCQSGDDAAPVVARARGTRLGSLARPRGQARLLSRLSPLQVAGFLRLRLGHAGRLGMPHLRHARLGARSRSAGCGGVPGAQGLAEGPHPGRQPDQVSFSGQCEARPGRAQLVRWPPGLVESRPHRPLRRRSRRLSGARLLDGRLPKA